MKNLEKLVSSYKTAFTEQDREHYRRLATEGQFPKIMVIGCSDSRVNPDLIFNAAPGDIFVVRNVANLVPPFEVDEASHGTSAAIEFAVVELKVEHIVVMGHSHCGGVRACCDNAKGRITTGLFLPKWTSILTSCAESVMKDNPDINIEELSQRVEQDAIKFSMKNLGQFPFIRDGIESGKLQIHGAYFDIKEAQLFALDKESQNFVPIE